MRFLVFIVFFLIPVQALAVCASAKDISENTGVHLARAEPQFSSIFTRAQDGQILERQKQTVDGKLRRVWGYQLEVSQ